VSLGSEMLRDSSSCAKSFITCAAIVTQLATTTIWCTLGAAPHAMRPSSCQHTRHRRDLRPDRGFRAQTRMYVRVFILLIDLQKASLALDITSPALTAAHAGPAPASSASQLCWHPWRNMSGVDGDVMGDLWIDALDQFLRGQEWRVSVCLSVTSHWIVCGSS